MKRVILGIILFSAFQMLFAQADYEKYWQQEVHYTIDATLDVETDILHGKEKLVYYNHSPHTLETLYFHLYQNAFTPGSYLSKIARGSNRPFVYGHYEQKGKAIEVTSLKIDAQKREWNIDNTIMEVPLKKPLPSGDSLVIEISFKTYFDIGANWRRMRVFKAYGVKNYNGGHWYPRISVFDRKFGWTADQHMVHEFYGDFGTYDVTLKLPKHYIVDATGLLQNKEEALPENLRQKLDLNNFKDKPLYSAPDTIIAPTNKLKTWHFKAQNVHDFAFIASPLFRFEEVEWNGTICRSIVMEPHAARWQDAAELTAEIIRIFSKDFGKYPYPKMIVADVRSGMEYPMLTMNSGLSPDYSYIFSHEIGHNWFFGTVASNETYRSALDEGFTQFMTNWALEKLQKNRTIESPPKQSFPQKFRNRNDLRYRTIFESYYKDAFYSDGTRLNQHSDKFNTKELYGTIFRQTYYKTSSMLYNLQYVLGDSLFKSCIQHYYETWKFRHPYLEDMRKAFINHSGVNLNWFFDQWLNTKKTIDYSVKNIKKVSDSAYQVRLERKARMEMPLDVQVLFKDGSSRNYHIPNRRFVKNTDAIVLKKWYGWDNLNPEYTFTVEHPSGVKEVIIDPEHKISDMNRLNNSSQFKPELHFDFLIDQPENPYQYEFYIRPDLWWNNNFGLKAGINLDGTYMKELHNVNLSLLYNIGWLNNPDEDYSMQPLSWNFHYNTRIKPAPGKAYLNLTSIREAGWNFNRIDLDYRGKENKNRLRLSINSSYHDAQHPIRYLPGKQKWSATGYDELYTFLRLEHIFDMRRGKLKTGITSSLGAIKNSFIDMEFLRRFELGGLQIRTRSFGRYGLTSSYPNEDALLLSGASPLQEMQNRIARSPGMIPADWKEFGSSPGHFQHPGGLNVRGYSGYYSVSRSEKGKLIYHYTGNTGLAFNSELSFGQYLDVFSPGIQQFFEWDFYLFFDAGTLTEASLISAPDFERFYMDAGSGFIIKIKQWGPFDKLKPLSLRFDMPLFLNIKPYGDNNNFQFRWLFGVEKSI